MNSSRLSSQPTRDPDFAPTVDSDIVGKPTAVKPQRLLSIDLLRGLTIAFMILVNNQTGPEPFHQLSHSDWNGFTATDLVFPTFLLLVGLTTVLSTAARLARGATRKELFLHTLRRAVLLILFGFVVNNFPFFHLATARYYGVLPRIGICYFVVATLYLLSPTWKDKAVIAVACLVGYWALIRFVPVPGFGVPTHGFPINDRDANLAAWLHRQLLSAPPLYQPLMVFGTNAILAYMISELGASILHAAHLKSPITHFFATAIPHPAWYSLLYSLAFVLVCWLLVLPLYRKRIFLRI